MRLLYLSKLSDLSEIVHCGGVTEEEWLKIVN